MAQDIRSHHWTDTWLQDLTLSCKPITEDDQTTVITTPQRTITWTVLDGCMARSSTNGFNTNYECWKPDGLTKKVHALARKDSPIRHYS